MHFQAGDGKFHILAGNGIEQSQVFVIGPGNPAFCFHRLHRDNLNEILQIGIKSGQPLVWADGQNGRVELVIGQNKIPHVFILRDTRKSFAKMLHRKCCQVAPHRLQGIHFQHQAQI